MSILVYISVYLLIQSIVHFLVHYIRCCYFEVVTLNIDVITLMLLR